MKKLARAGLLALTTTLMAAPALAHPGHGFGLVAGVLHPLTGPDHLAAMLAVGLWSGFALPRRIWAGAATFLAAMSLGAGLGLAGLTLPLVEPAILTSVLVLGLMLATARASQARGITAASLTLIGVFAAAHGQAHAIEAAGPVLPYVTGMLAATLVLHLLGLGIAAAVVRSRAALTLQALIGAGIAGAGLLLMAAG